MTYPRLVEISRTKWARDVPVSISSNFYNICSVNGCYGIYVSFSVMKALIRISGRKQSSQVSWFSVSVRERRVSS